MKKRLAIRIYRNYDMDLMALSMVDYPLNQEMKRALIAKALNTHYVALKFNGIINPNIEIQERCKCITFCLDSAKPEEAEALMHLERIRKGLMAGYIKTIFRSGFEQLPLDCFYKELDNTMSAPIIFDTKQNKKQVVIDINQEKTEDNISTFVSNEEIIDTPKRASKEVASNNEISKFDEFDSLFDAMDVLSHT